MKEVSWPVLYNSIAPASSSQSALCAMEKGRAKKGDRSSRLPRKLFAYLSCTNQSYTASLFWSISRHARYLLVTVKCCMHHGRIKPVRLSDKEVFLRKSAFHRKEGCFLCEWLQNILPFPVPQIRRSCSTPVYVQHTGTVEIRKSLTRRHSTRVF
jgi:hypothetical protein